MQSLTAAESSNCFWRLFGCQCELSCSPSDHNDVESPDAYLALNLGFAFVGISPCGFLTVTCAAPLSAGFLSNLSNPFA